MDSLAIAVANIRRLMEKKGWSGNRLADFSGLPRGYVSALLAQRSFRKDKPPHSPTLRTLDKISAALEVSTGELLVPLKPVGGQKKRG